VTRRPCTTCKREYPFNAKYFAKRSDGGLRVQCIECYRSRQRSRRKGTRLYGLPVWTGLDDSSYIEGVVSKKFRANDAVSDDSPELLLTKATGMDGNGSVLSVCQVLLDEEVWQEVSRGDHVRLWIKDHRTQYEVLNVPPDPDAPDPVQTTESGSDGTSELDSEVSSEPEQAKESIRRAMGFSKKKEVGV
jgi:hypothetical protein